MFSGNDHISSYAESDRLIRSEHSHMGVMPKSPKSGTLIAQIEQLYADLDRVKERAGVMTDTQKRHYYEQLNTITNKRAELNQLLEALKSASVSSYDEVKKNIEEHILEIEMLLTQMQTIL